MKRICTLFLVLGWTVACLAVDAKKLAEHDASRLEKDGWILDGSESLTDALWSMYSIIIEYNCSDFAGDAFGISSKEEARTEARREALTKIQCFIDDYWVQTPNGIFANQITENPEHSVHHIGQYAIGQYIAKFDVRSYADANGEDITSETRIYSDGREAYSQVRAEDVEYIIGIYRKNKNGTFDYRIIYLINTDKYIPENER